MAAAMCCRLMVDGLPSCGASGLVWWSCDHGKAHDAMLMGAVQLQPAGGGTLCFLGRLHGSTIYLGIAGRTYMHQWAARLMASASPQAHSS